MLFSHVDICFKKRGSRNERCCAEKKERNACMTVQIWGSKWFQRETVEHEIEQRCESIKLLSSPIRIRITKIISSPIFDRYYFFVFKPIAIPMKDSITFFEWVKHSSEGAASQQQQRYCVHCFVEQLSPAWPPTMVCYWLSGLSRPWGSFTPYVLGLSLCPLETYVNKQFLGLLLAYHVIKMMPQPIFLNYRPIRWRYS
jgi:hypothetical protein